MKERMGNQLTMASHSKIFDMEGEDRTSEGVSDTSVPEPLEDDEDVEGGNTDGRRSYQ